MSEENERTLWCGNLSEKADEELLYELFLQAGPIEMVKIPRDNEKRPRSYAFITYTHAVSVEYAINIFEGTKLFQRPLTLHKKSKSSSNPSASQRDSKGNFNSNQQQNRGHRHSNDRGQFNASPNMNQILSNVQEVVDQFNRQALSGMGQMQQNQPARNDRQHHQQKPYSRDREDNNQAFSRNRNQRDRGPNNRRGSGGGNQRRSDYHGRRSN